MASLVLGAVGAGIGFMVGGPFGAQVGWMIGAAAGGLLDPVKSEGPHIGDLKVQSSEYGGMIPIMFGTFRLSGKVCWAQDKIEHPHTSGGKGGGPQVTTYSATQSFAVRLCEGPDKIVTQVFANGRLIWDPALGVDEIEDCMVQYPGSETQLPDPTIEAVRGVGQVNANRGICYVVFTNLQLDQFGGMIPNLTFTITTSRHDDKPITLVVRNNNANNPFVTGGGDDNPGPGVTSWPLPGSTTGLIRTKITYTSNVQTFDPTTLAYVGTEAPGPDDVWLNAVEISTSDSWSTRKFRFIGTYVYADGSTTPLWAIVGIYRVDTLRADPLITWDFAVPVIPDSPAPFTGTGPSGPFVTHGTNFLSIAGVPGTDIPIAICLSNNGKMCFVACSSGYSGYSYPYADKWYRIIDGVIHSTGMCSPYLTAAFMGGASMSAAGTSGAMFENDYRNCWISSTNAALITVFWIDDANNFAQATVHNVPSGPGLAFGLPGAYGGFGDRAFTYALPGGCKCAFIDGEALYLVERCDINEGATTYAAVVAAISERVGFTSAQYNVSQIEDPLDGYCIANRMPARSAIEALLPLDYFDGVESDCKAKFVKRGGASVVTIPDDDLGAFAEGSQPTALIKRTRGLELALPYRIDFVFVDKEADYQNGTQSSPPRQGGESMNPMTLSAAVAMDNARGKQIADANFFAAWYGRDRSVTYVPPKYLWLEPTDVVTIQGKTERIVDKHESMSGPTTLDLVAEFAANWTQSSIPAPNESFEPQEPPVKQVTDLIPLDIPWFGSREDVFWGAMAGHDRESWRGASLRKYDGANYNEIALSNTHDTFGTVATPLGNFTWGNVFDEINKFTVVLTPGSGELVSTTRDLILAGGNPNYAVLGDELIQYLDAVLTAPKTYLISRLIRGCKGTEWAISGHIADENFVKLPIQTELASVFAEYGVSKQFKAVTIGSAEDTAAVVNFTNNGRSLKCYSPVHLGGGRDSIGNIELKWVNRTRVNGEWVSGIEAPLGETSERYRVTIYMDGTYATVGTYLFSTTPTATFSTIGQIAEFGYLLATGYCFWGVRQYDSLGRLGYESRSVT